MAGWLFLTWAGAMRYALQRAADPRSSRQQVRWSPALRAWYVAPVNAPPAARRLAS